jgi:hypothetical protein
MFNDSVNLVVNHFETNYLENFVVNSICELKSFSTTFTPWLFTLKTPVVEGREIICRLRGSETRRNYSAS